ncbi:MAG TPA: hypothetical protein VFI05_01905, partial [Nitrospiraceae bacterium]|nr:hypothetical protein [Nitrospiraceae bacterium]
MAHVEYLVRDAAEQEACASFSSMRPDHDQIGLQGVGTLKNDGSRRSDLGDRDCTTLNGRQTGGNIFG